MNSIENLKNQASKKNVSLFILTLLNFFILSLVSNIPGVLIPFWEEDFALSKQLVSLLGFSFFFAYGLTSLPQSIFLGYISNRKALLFALFLIIGGSILFALKPIFILGIISLFLIGIGITALQIKANLLVKKIDTDVSKYSKNLTMSQVAFGFGGLGGGFLISYLINNLGLKWNYVYFVFAGLSILIIFLMFFTNIPEVQKENLKDKNKFSLKEYLNLFKEQAIWMFSLGIFVYVGIEVGIANWLATFLIDKFAILKTDATKVVSLYWACQSLGRFTSGFFLSKLSTGKILSVYALLCFLSLICAVLSKNLAFSIIGFGFTGFFTSVMFPSIFSSAVNHFGEKKESTVAGVLCTAILGGAIIQFIIAFGSELIGSLGKSMIIVSLLSFAYLIFLGTKISKGFRTTS